MKKLLTVCLLAAVVVVASGWRWGASDRARARKAGEARVATVTKETAAITATAAVTPQAPAAVTPTITIVLQGGVLYDSTGAACTNAAGVAAVAVTNVSATCSELPAFATNATVAVSLVNAGAVMTNATVAVAASE
jgi:hypothetical protein